MQRRHRRASFMSSSFVFPGGAVSPSDGDLRVTAARELFEEAGVLLARSAGEVTDIGVRTGWRVRALDDENALHSLLADAALSFDMDGLHYFSHWITPAIERKRFSAVFYVARLPDGQTASVDNREMVEDLWITPEHALERADELRLPPPQLRTLLDLLEPARQGFAGILQTCRFRAAHPHPLLPRARQPESESAPRTLMLPWDPEYLTRGLGDSLPIPAHHPLALGPSRFVLEGQTWKHTAAAPSAQPE